MACCTDPGFIRDFYDGAGVERLLARLQHRRPLHRSRRPFSEPKKRLLITRLHHLADQGGRCDEADGQALFSMQPVEAECNMRLSRAAWNKLLSDGYVFKCFAA